MSRDIVLIVDQPRHSRVLNTCPSVSIDIANANGANATCAAAPAAATPLRPDTCQALTAATPDGPTNGLLREAAAIGRDTATLVEVILRSRPHPEQGFRACLGILRQYGTERLEAACRRGLEIGARSAATSQVAVPLTLALSEALQPDDLYIRSRWPAGQAQDGFEELTRLRLRPPSFMAVAPVAGS